MRNFSNAKLVSFSSFLKFFKPPLITDSIVISGLPLGSRKRKRKEKRRQVIARDKMKVSFDERREEMANTRRESKEKTDYRKSTEKE